MIDIGTWKINIRLVWHYDILHTNPQVKFLSDVHSITGSLIRRNKITAGSGNSPMYKNIYALHKYINVGPPSPPQSFWINMFYVIPQENVNMTHCGVISENLALYTGMLGFTTTKTYTTSQCSWKVQFIT